ncbi:Rho-type GTPase-activating protein 1 [Fusarium oxysporum f. sp. albedinis]|nr:Rho-type GTPase-activating protein 1 [Fusarium oxysporum f. sp. albedinis]
MCQQIFSFKCHHMKYMPVPCQKIKDRQKQFLRPILDWLCPVRLCKSKIEGQQRPDHPCDTCLARPFTATEQQNRS